MTIVKYEKWMFLESSKFQLKSQLDYSLQYLLKKKVKEQTAQSTWQPSNKVNKQKLTKWGNALQHLQ